jgi:hypothetical protein
LAFDLAHYPPYIEGETQMNKIRYTFNFLVFTVAVLISASLANAQATRTWVSGVGDDVNPCSRTAPCKTFAGAISKTASGGEINAIDPGGFGALTVTKSITVDGAGTMASTLASLTTGFIINAAGINVTIRNISINGAGNGIDGIRFLQGTSLLVENVTIGNFTGIGIKWAPSTADGTLTVKNTTISHCTLGAVSMVNTSGFGRGMIFNSSFHKSLFGVKAGSLTGISVSDSTANGCTDGFLGDGGQAQMNLQRVNASHNTTGVKVNNGAAVRVSYSQISNNTSFGLDLVNGFLESDTTNIVRGNPNTDPPTPVPPV